MLASENCVLTSAATGLHWHVTTQQTLTELCCFPTLNSCKTLLFQKLLLLKVESRSWMRKLWADQCTKAKRSLLSLFSKYPWFQLFIVVSPHFLSSASTPVPFKLVIRHISIRSGYINDSGIRWTTVSLNQRSAQLQRCISCHVWACWLSSLRCV